MENFYSKLRKPKLHNPGYGKKHFIEIPFRMLIVGPSGSGKTNALLNLLKATTDTWDHITLCLKDANEPLYRMLIDKLGDDITVHEGSVPDLADISKLPKERQQLFVFDDLVGDKVANQSILTYYKMARKKNISCCYLSQSYYGVPKFIRSNLSHLLIVKVSSKKDLRLILSEYPLPMSIKDLNHIYDECTREFTDVMLLDLLHGEIYKNLIIRAN